VHDVMLAWYVLSTCAVHMSVTSWHCTKMSKRWITQTTSSDSSLWHQKISTKFQRGHPQRGRQMELGKV